MSLRDYLKEHNKLIGRLSGNDDPALDAEADDQEKEVEDTLKEKKKKNPASIRGALKAAAEEKSED
jgi:broad specificity phosphatase PhoE